MFGYRADGRKLKTVGPFFRVIPLVMKKRSDAHVYYSQDVALEKLDAYIEKTNEEKGIKLSYMEIIYAALVRTIGEKPCLNRFVMNGRTYARHGIDISLAIKKEMSENIEETTLKIRFDGTENIFQIRDKLEKVISENKDVSAENETDKFAKILSHVPTFIMKIAVNFLLWLDKHGMLPMSVINLSPFHTTAFLTNVGSLGIDAIYHHIYDVGTCGMFVAMGKKKKSYIYEDDEIKQEKSITLNIVADERICDGFYYANAMKTFFKYLKKPELLETNIEKKEDIK